MLRELTDKTHFSIMNGDFIYEEHRSMSPSAWLMQAGLTADQAPRIIKLAPNMVGLWENYKTYLARGVNLSAWQRNMPTAFTFDDHELVNLKRKMESSTRSRR
jgi:phosphodiesterase/alkaline phosphatase D-like protein